MGDYIRNRLGSVSFFCPTYKDENSIIYVVEKASAVLPTIADRFEIVIIEDGSPDNTSRVVDELAAKHPHVRVIHHPTNLGYGAAIRSGFINTHCYDYICYTDGDNQYDVADIAMMIPLLDHHDMVVSYRLNKSYGHYRMFMSKIYNLMVRKIFNIAEHDVGSPTRIFRRDIAPLLKPLCNSPFANAEIIVRARAHNISIGSVGICSYPRVFGKSSVASVRNILGTLCDIFILRYRLTKRLEQTPVNHRHIQT